MSTANQPAAITDGSEKKEGDTTKKKSKVIAPKVETMFCLQPLKIVEVHVKFKAPPQTETSEWPMTIRNER